MGRRCRICDSIHLDEYNSLFLGTTDRGQWNAKDIWKYARTTHNETFSYSSMLHHFNRDVKGIIQAHKRADRTRAKIIEEEIEKEILIIQDIRNSLEKLHNQMEELEERTEDPKARKEIRDIISTSMKVIEISLRFHDQLKTRPKDKEEDVYKKVLLCMKDFPLEYINKFQDNWMRYED